MIHSGVIKRQAIMVIEFSCSWWRRVSQMEILPHIYLAFAVGPTFFLSSTLKRQLWNESSEKLEKFLESSPRLLSTKWRKPSEHFTIFHEKPCHAFVKAIGDLSFIPLNFHFRNEGNCQNGPFSKLIPFKIIHHKIFRQLHPPETRNNIPSTKSLSLFGSCYT